MSIKILFIGDIVGKPAREAVKKLLPDLKEKYQTDLVIANAENLAHGIGITEKTLAEVKEAGIDIFTSGNHFYKKSEGLEILKAKDSPLIRPANYPQDVPGRGYQIVEAGTKKIAVINLIGRVFFTEHFDCPFRKADEIIEEIKKEKPAATIVDIHAEATSEKVALGFYLDGRVSAVLGTHTHIPTADQRILSQGTAYITDVGMVGLLDSVLGVDKEIIIEKFLSQLSIPHDISENGRVVFNAVYLEIDGQSGKAVKLERIDREVEV